MRAVGVGAPFDFAVGYGVAPLPRSEPVEQALARRPVGQEMRAGPHPPD
jgi:hypothetical protein